MSQPLPSFPPTPPTPPLLLTADMPCQVIRVMLKAWNVHYNFAPSDLSLKPRQLRTGRWGALDPQVDHLYIRLFKKVVLPC